MNLYAHVGNDPLSNVDLLGFSRAKLEALLLACMASGETTIGLYFYCPNIKDPGKRRLCNLAWGAALAATVVSCTAYEHYAEECYPGEAGKGQAQIDKLKQKFGLDGDHGQPQHLLQPLQELLQRLLEGWRNPQDMLPDPTRWLERNPWILNIEVPGGRLW